MITETMEPPETGLEEPGVDHNLVAYLAMTAVSAIVPVPAAPLVPHPMKRKNRCFPETD